MRKIYYALLLVPFFFFYQAIACINEYYRTEPPLSNDKLEIKYLLKPEGDNMPYWTHGFSHAIPLDIRRDSLMNVGLEKLDYKGLSDYAAIELRIGDKQNAVKTLEKLYKQYPNEYNIVVNLGTAYEVTGNNEKAYELIKKAMAINPLSHYGSEWIHLNILEQKRTGKIWPPAIVDLNIGNDFSKWLLNKAYQFPKLPDSLKLQLAYQLHERIAFIAPPDKIVGQLILDFADIVAKTDAHKEAKPFYDYALKYDPQLKSSINQRMKSLNTSEKIVKDTFRWASVIWAIPLVTMALIFIAWLRNRKMQSMQS